MSILQPTITQSQQIEITQYINAYRANNQAPPLVWDSTIAGFSQNWAYYLNFNNVFTHSGSSLYGENLAFLQGYGTDIMFLIKKSIDLWYAEISLYDFNNPGFSDATGHFTCLVWKSSTKFGMGITLNSKTNSVDITMNTSPPGNVLGRFKENVLPLIANPTVPVPVPNPSPVPVPIPVPVPNPVPVPVPNPVPPKPDLSVNQRIIQKLKNIKLDIQNKTPRYFIISNLNSVIRDLYATTLSQYRRNKVISKLQNIIFLIQKYQNDIVIMNAIDNVIQDL